MIKRWKNITRHRGKPSNIANPSHQPYTKPKPINQTTPLPDLNNQPFETAIVPYPGHQHHHTKHLHTIPTYHTYPPYIAHKEVWMPKESLQHKDTEMVLQIRDKYQAKQTREPPQPHITFLNIDHNHPMENEEHAINTSYLVETPPDSPHRELQACQWSSTQGSTLA